MSLFIFNNILANAISALCNITLKAQIPHHVISDCFQRWRRSSMAENWLHIFTSFSTVQGFLKVSFQIKASLLAWKSGLSEVTAAYVWSESRYFEKEWFNFCCKNTSWLYNYNFFMERPLYNVLFYLKLILLKNIITRLKKKKKRLKNVGCQIRMQNNLLH